MAPQLYERFPIEGYVDDSEELLNKAQPNVVHITPPHSHLHSSSPSCVWKPAVTYMW
jgi:hypothetical protein